MKDILTIVLRLTVSCLLAGLVMGAAFIFTDKAKTHNEHVNEQRVMLGLLGYSAAKPAPPTLALHSIYRYLITSGQAVRIGYLLPLAGEGEKTFCLVQIDLDGGFVDRLPVAIAEEQLGVDEERLKAVQAALGGAAAVRYADRTIVVTDGGSRKAYLLPGKFPGFKTFINVLMALDPAYGVLGLEIMEHEEDPGLGAEIAQGYFKGQFTGKDFEAVKRLEVVKTPMPEDYRQALTGEGLGPEELARIEAQYKDTGIYALTGATISSRSVTNGVKGIVKKFAYRMAILDRVLAEQGITVPF